MILLSGTIFILLGINIELFVCKNLPRDSFEFAKNESEEYELVFAHVIFRHGNRNVFRPYPKDPYNDEDKWPGGFAALTKVGRQQQFELGQYLRKRYQELIGAHYSPKKVYIRSSDTDRTLMSAQCNAAGMFPPAGDEVWSKELPNWQPIPIHTIPFSDDYLLNSFMPCSRYDQLYKEFTESKEFKYQMNGNSDLIEYLRTNTGKTLSNSIEVMYLFALLVDEKEKGLVFPPWVDGIFQYTNDTLEQILAIHMETATHTNLMKKMKAGYLIKEMLDRFKNKSLSQLQPDRSLWIYSAHDMTIANLLNSLGLFELHAPAYASSLFFELYRQNDSYFVHLSYRKTPTEIIPTLDIPNCEAMCPLDKFYQLYKHILPTDFESFDSLCRLAS